MNIKVVSADTIKPSAPTPPHLATFTPSFIDQTAAPFYIPLTVFYPSAAAAHRSTRPDTHARLKAALSKTLNRFYPLAGRILGPSSISCNDEGVLYKEAEADFELLEYLERPELNILNKLLPVETNSMEKGPGFQVAVQVSVFACGGVVIGTCFFHRIVDVRTMANFLKTWADLCGPTSDEQASNQDVVDLELGSALFPPPPSFPIDYFANKTRYFFSDGRDYQFARRFVFSSSAIAALREKARSAAVPNPSRVESLTGFLSQRLHSGLRKSTVFTQAVNIRPRIDPPLPETAFGNFIWYAAAVYGQLEEGEEVGMPDYVAAMREALEAVRGEELASLEPEAAVRVLSENLGMLVEAGIRVYKFSSWCNMGFYNLDFGWGRPIWVAHMGDGGLNRTKHQLMLLEGRNEGEIELWVMLGEGEMGILENDEEFLVFATPNPSILVK